MIPVLVGWIGVSFGSGVVQAETQVAHQSALCVSSVCARLGVKMQPFVCLEMLLAC